MQQQYVSLTDVGGFFPFNILNILVIARIGPDPYPHLHALIPHPHLSSEGHYRLPDKLFYFLYDFFDSCIPDPAGKVWVGARFDAWVAGVARRGCCRAVGRAAVVEQRPVRRQVPRALVRVQV